MTDERRTHVERFISASELGDYAYCRRAWWLRAVQGMESAEQGDRFARGHAGHRAHARVLRAARLLLLLASLLVAGAVGLLHVAR